MNVITHFLLGWSLFEGSALERRDRQILACASVAPDADGLGALVDQTNRVLSRPESFLFGEWHHRLLHGLPGALLFAVVASILGRERLRVAAATFAMVHLHLACDFLGSRGPSPADVWPIWYLAPLSDAPELSWSGQWALNAWPNICLTLALLMFAFAQAVRVGSSPVAMFHGVANRVFVETVRRRWERLRNAV